MRFAQWPKIAVTACFITAVAVSAPGSEADRSAPKTWEQWPPDAVTSDRRLDQAVSVWEKDIEVGDLLARLSEQSEVAVDAAREMRHLPLSVFVEHATLRSIMVALAQLYDTHWQYRNAGAQRVYRLSSHERLRSPYPGMLYWASEKRRRAEHAESKEERSKRLDLYRETLSLDPNDVLGRYEETDPWLCATILDPAKRPMIEYVLNLSDADRQTLMTEGTLTVPVRRLEKGFREHLALWSAGEWGKSVCGLREHGPDYLPRFPAQEMRFEHSFITLFWYERGLQLSLDIPDEHLHAAIPIDMRYLPPTAPREELVRLGYREKTPEYLQAMERENQAWEQARAEEARRRRDEKGEAQAARFRGLQASDRVLSSELALSGLRGIVLSPSDILEAAARQCGVGVVVQRVAAGPPWRGVPRELLATRKKHSLAAVLERMCQWMGSDWHWDLQGEILIAGSGSEWCWQPARVPEDTAVEWHERLHPGSTQPLEELATFLGQLDIRELKTLRNTDLTLVYLPLVELRIYGLFDPEQRSLMARAQGLPFRELSSNQQRMLVLVARETHPWVEISDLAHVVLNTVQHRLSTGDEGISLIINYHFPDAPLDRDVIFTAPLQITIPTHVEV